MGFSFANAVIRRLQGGAKPRQGNARTPGPPCRRSYGAACPFTGRAEPRVHSRSRRSWRARWRSSWWRRSERLKPAAVVLLGCSRRSPLMGATPPPQTPAFEEELSLLEILHVLLKRWRTVIGLPVTMSIVVLGVSFLVPTTYTATTSFVPAVRSQGRVPAG